MRLLFLHHFDLDLAGGSGTYLRLLRAAFHGLGHETEVVSARRPDRYGCSTYALPFDFTLTFGPERRDGERTFDDFTPAELEALSARAERSVEEQAFAGGKHPDVVLVNHISLLAETARRLSIRHGVPYRIVSYGTDTRLLVNDRRYVEWLRPAVEGADRVFAISDFVARQARSVLPGVEVEVLGGAVDRAVFRPATEPPDPADRVAFVGRLVTEKGIWTLVDALRRLGDGVTLDVIGEGPLLPALRDAGSRAGAPRLNLLGYLPADGVREALVRSAVLVVPSVWEEPLGLVVLEAMACGVPVVASSVGGIPEMVQHGRNGLLVQPADAEGLAAALGRILGDRSLRLRLRRHCLTDTPLPSYADLARAAIA